MKENFKTIIVDSDSETAAWLKDVVEKSYPGTKVIVTGIKDAVIGLIIKNNPEVVFLDISAEEKNGIKICSEIRKSILADKVSVVFLSAKNSKQTLSADALDAGADAILRKPVDLTELRVLLKSLNKIKAIASENKKEATSNCFGSHLDEAGNSTKDETALENISLLRESEEKFRKLFENHSAVKLLIDPEDGRIIDANRSAVDFYGWSRAELIQMDISQINTLDLKEIKKLMASAHELRRNYFEFKHRVSNGTARDVAVYTAGIEINGKPILHSIIHDISEQHLIYEALEASEKRLKRAELVSKTGNWELHLKTKTIVGSDGALEIYGLKEKFIDYNIIKEIPLPEYRQKLDSALIQLITKEQPYNVDFKIKTFTTGEIKDIHSEAVFDSERQIVFGIIQDVTAWKQTELKLKESEEKYRIMFETALEGIVVVQEYKLVFFNPAIAEISGYSKEELTLMPFNNLVHKDDLGIVIENYNNRLENKTPVQNYEFRINRKNGEIRWVVLTGARLLWNGKPATFNFITDVTDRKLAELSLRASEEKYRLITENSSDVIWIFNLAQMKFTYISPSISNLRGYTVKEAMNQTLEESLTPESRKMVEEGLFATLPEFMSHKSSEKTRSINQVQQPCKNGQIIWVEVATQYQFNATGEIEILGVSRNIEERKKMEVELRRNEVELRELVATKDKFFSIIAHDLKSPFNNIAGFSELLTNEAKTLDITEIIQYSGLIQTSAKNTLVLLENLLEWAQIQRGQMRFNPVPVIISELVNEVLELIKHDAKHKQIDLENSVSDDLILKVDINMFKLLIRNLVANAVKFSNIGGCIKISAEKSSENCHISVKDNGIGISSENIDKLFSITTGYIARGTANEKGTGLGLILCKEFVEKHNGRISVESQLGKGSNFVIEIPLKK